MNESNAKQQQAQVVVVEGRQTTKWSGLQKPGTAEEADRHAGKWNKGTLAA